MLGGETGEDDLEQLLLMDYLPAEPATSSTVLSIRVGCKPWRKRFTLGPGLANSAQRLRGQKRRSVRGLLDSVLVRDGVLLASRWIDRPRHPPQVIGQIGRENAVALRRQPFYFERHLLCGDLRWAHFRLAGLA